MASDTAKCLIKWITEKCNEQFDYSKRFFHSEGFVNCISEVIQSDLIPHESDGVNYLYYVLANEVIEQGYDDSLLKTPVYNNEDGMISVLFVLFLVFQIKNKNELENISGDDYFVLRDAVSEWFNSHQHGKSDVLSISMYSNSIKEKTETNIASIDDLNLKISEMNAQIQKHSRKYEKKASQEIAALEGSLLIKSTEVSQSDRELAEMDSILSTKKEAHTKMMEQVATKESIEAKIHSLENQIATLSNKILQKGENPENKMADLEKEKAEITILIENLKNIETQINDAHTIILDLESKIQSPEITINNWRQSLSEEKTKLENQIKLFEHLIDFHALLYK